LTSTWFLRFVTALASYFSGAKNSHFAPESKFSAWKLGVGAGPAVANMGSASVAPMAEATNNAILVVF
jgi:hypothetical protein